MQVLTNVTVGDADTDGATIQGVIDSNGGYFLISNNSVFMQLQYNLSGQLSWTKEILIPQGSGQIYPGTCGIRFRNAIAGSPAVVNAAISEQREPAISIGASGVANVGASSSSMQLIQQIGPLLAASLSIDFAAIPSTFKHLRIVGQLRSNNASFVVPATMTFNGDGTASYDYNEFANRTAGSFNRVAVAGNFFDFAEISAASDAAGSASPLLIDIPNYAGTVLRKQYFSTSFGKNGGDADATNFITTMAGGEWRNTSAINRVTITAGAGSWDVGSMLSLYGIL